MCILVSKDPRQYAEAIVPVNFSKRSAADDAAKRFVENTVWELRNPAFDTRSRPDYVGSPIKKVVLLQSSTQLRAVTALEQKSYSFPAMHIEPPVTIAALIGLKNMTVAGRTPDPGGVTKDGGSRAVDLACKLLTKGERRDVIKEGKALSVIDIEVADDSMLEDKPAKCSISFWGKPIDVLGRMSQGAGMVVLGCTA